MILFTLVPPHLLSHLDTILSLLEQEFQHLAVGIEIFDSFKQENRVLKAFLLRVVTDMVARKEVMNERKEKGGSEKGRRSEEQEEKEEDRGGKPRKYEEI